MTKTTNYQLPKWEKTDRIQMSDFNDMTATLDAALGTIPKLAVGTYTGDGAAENTITLGFKPSFMLVTQAIPGERSSDRCYLWLLGEYTKLERPDTVSTTMAGPYVSGDTELFLARRTDTGVIFVKHPDWDGCYNMNVNGKQYAYIAIG